MKLKQVVAIALCLALAAPITVSAHSGRTDKNGGHRDSANGDYHYHHGYEAHYHPGGVCPYEVHHGSTATPLMELLSSISENLSSISKTVICAVHEWKTIYQI